MRHIQTATIILTTFLCLVACSNAGAKNDKKTTPSKGAVVELSTETFSNKVYDIEKEALEYLGKLPAIVDFTASWCGPCQKIAPILEELAVEYKNKIVIYKVDVDKCRELSQAFGISSVPAVLFIPTEGEPVMTVGARNKEQFKEQINTILLK